ncbi:MAG UNVERIFIED_CONTAM: hypothetical protein LVR18_34620 [Planctomycetaceae bacterium]
MTATGDITIQDTAGGLDVSSIDVNGDSSSTTGVRIMGGSASDIITIRTSSPLTISSNVTNTGGGNIVLAAEGTATTDNLTINADITATGGNGAVSLYAGNNITLSSISEISVAGSGAILLRASTNYNGGALIVNGYNGPLAEASTNGLVSMTSGSTITSATGDITIRGTVTSPSAASPAPPEVLL